MRKILLSLAACLLLFALFPRGTSVSATAELPQERLVALTFDDGPYAPVTERILDVLEQNGARATFFVVGERVDFSWRELARADALGCEIGNHTFTHADLTALSPAERREEITLTNTAIRSCIGRLPTLVRPPYGFSNAQVLAEFSLRSVGWTVDTEDWKTRDAAKTFDCVRRETHAGSVILMHDLYPATADAVEKIVPWLIGEGYRLVTVSELIASGASVPTFVDLI